MIKNYKFILLGLLMLLLLLPLLQEKLNLVEITPLKGAIAKPDRPDFYFHKWFEGTFQKESETYHNEEFGFRPFLVRLNNQIAFDLFNVAKANGVIIGKDNYLYEENYIKAYYGEDFIGDHTIADRLKKIKSLQDTLKKRKIDLLLVYAPGKAGYFPEFIPEKYQDKRGQTNLETYVNQSKSLGINYINLNDYFIQKKAKSLYPLYPKYGIHWSTYGDFVVADTLSKYIEKIKGIDLPDLIIDSVVIEDSKFRDNDIAYGMNLLFKFPPQKLGYPKYHFEEENKVKPKTLVVSDSYFWGMFGLGLADKIMAEPDFLYYGSELYQVNKPNQKREQIDMKRLIESQSMVIILCTDGNLPNFGWTFIDDATLVFENNIELINKSNREIEIDRMIAQIRNTPSWLADVKKKADARGILLDSMIRADAIFMIDSKNQQ
jgi:hypothetical protein